VLPVRVIRLSNSYRDREDKQLAWMRATIAEARQLLADHAPPDTFMGRKTQEPFPKEQQ
jgi:hypothetical protein